MSPCDPSQHGDGLEHPLGAFAHYAAAGLRQVICEEKQTGLRGVAVVCRDMATAARRFGVGDGTAGVIHSRTGHRSLPAIDEASLVGAIRTAADAAGLWTSLDTDWLCLDGELIGLANAGTDRSTPRFVLFHLLAAEGRTFFDRKHVWHLDTLRRLCAAQADGGSLGVTQHRVIDLTRPTEVAAAIAWWHALTANGAEGIVVKPLTLAGGGLDGPVQPALKVRGAEWLRRVYGKNYREPVSLGTLRDRNLTTKRARALGQFAIGIEALERFVAGERRERVAACLAAHGAWVPAEDDGG
jgi:protein phosphatase